VLKTVDIQHGDNVKFRGNRSLWSEVGPLDVSRQIQMIPRT